MSYNPFDLTAKLDYKPRLAARQVVVQTPQIYQGARKEWVELL